MYLVALYLDYQLIFHVGMETGLSLDIHNEMEKKIRKDSVI